MKLLFLIFICPLFLQAQISIPLDAQKPVSENAPIKIPLSKTKRAKIPKPKPPTTVVLDARPFFEFTVSHVEKSQPIRWEDYAQTEDPFKGMLEPDLSIIARKLRALGISPSTEVIVLGNGLKGHGEEGRIAWMLNYMGVKNVKTMNYAEFSGRKINGELRDNFAPPIWIAKPLEKIRIKKSDLEKGDFTLVDVRPASEFSKANFPQALSLPWTEFLNSKGGPKTSAEIREMLERRGVKSTSPIVFLSQKGVESGYATFITNQVGIDAKNCDGCNP